MSNVDRHMILRALQDELEPLPFVHALWESGSAAFGNLDEMSDLDLGIDADDQQVEEVFRVVEAALTALSPIDLRWRLADPTWHGNPQAFYRLRDTSPFLLVDLCVLKRSSNSRFDERERHGDPAVLFDKLGVVRPRALDRAALRTRLEADLEELKLKFELFQPFIEKELVRGNTLGALSFYQGMTLAPTSRVLRILHAPARHDFGARYAAFDLPEALVRELEELSFIGGPDELLAKRARAEELFWSAMDTLAKRGIPL